MPREARSAERGGGNAAPGIAQELEALEGTDAAALRRLWEARRGAPPPRSLSGRLMRLALAHDAQAAAHGGETARLARAWRKVEEARAAGADATSAAEGATPTRRPAAPGGARLIRTWRGETHEVLVTGEGAEWKGRRYASLSAVARAITGTRRNGPAFFGLREGSAR